MSDDPLLRECRKIIAIAGFKIMQTLSEYSNAHIGNRTVKIDIKNIVDTMVEHVKLTEKGG